MTDTPYDPSIADTVGYRKPPKGHQFKPGQSGNPRGRPKGAKSLKAILAEELGEKITATENGRNVRISKLQAILKMQVAKAAHGGISASQYIVGLHIKAHGLEDLRPDVAPLTQADQALLDRLLASGANTESSLDIHPAEVQGTDDRQASGESAPDAMGPRQPRDPL